MTRIAVMAAALLLIACGRPAEIDPGGQPAMPGEPGSSTPTGPSETLLAATWQPVGSMPGWVSAMAFLPEGAPIVASVVEDCSPCYGRNPPTRLVVKRWTGTEWSPLGSIDPPARYAMALLVDQVSGAPLVAAPISKGTLQVLRWNGTSWQPLGQPLGDDAAGRAYSATLTQDSRGRLWLAWSVSTDERWGVYHFGEEHLEAAWWDGQAWQKLPEGPPFAGEFLESTVDGQGNLVVAAALNNHVPTGRERQVRVFRWNGVAWQDLGEVSPLYRVAYWGRISLALDASQAPVVAWADLSEASGLSTERGPIRIRRWSGSTWEELDPPEEASFVALAARVDGALVLGHGGGVGLVESTSWRGLQTVSLPLARPMYIGAFVAFAPDGRLFAALTETGVNGFEVFVLK